ncbi:MAG: diaminopimelate epimerase, partial [Tateyamaria sp.]
MRAMQDGRDSTFPFMKMHGLGNDFVVVDARAYPIAIDPSLARALADRRRGVGFDQLAVITPGTQDAHLTFYNADGSRSAACGNATRCIARYLMEESGQSALVLTTDRGVLAARDAGDSLTSVNMGQPQLDWQEVPLAREMDTLSLPIDGTPVATGMGNP